MNDPLQKIQLRLDRKNYYLVTNFMNNTYAVSERVFRYNNEDKHYYIN